MVFVVLCPGTPEGSTSNGSGFKASQKTGQWFKVSSDRHIYYCFCGHVPWLYQYWPGGFMFLWFYVQELMKAQPAVVLVLKRLRRWATA